MTTSPYPGEAEREREIEELARQAGAEVQAIGASVEGRALHVVRVPCTGEGPWQNAMDLQARSDRLGVDPASGAAGAGEDLKRPPRESQGASHFAMHLEAAVGAEPRRVLVHANIHGPEWIASRVAMGVLERLARGNEDAQQLRARAEIWVLPCINVDGFARVERQRGMGTLKELRTNSHGVDLNRNFPVPTAPLPWLARHVSARFAGSGSSDPRRATYRGTEPLCEPEARAVAELCRQQSFVASAGLHSFMGTCIPPCVTTSEEARAYRGLARALRRGQAGARYWTLASRALDVFTGELEDYLHHELACWAMTIECFSLGQSIAQHVRAPSLFWRFNPHDSARVVDNDAPGVIAFLSAALDVPHPRRR